MAKSICTKCSCVFSSTSAFDMHRTGSYGEAIYSGKNVVYTKASRRCISVPEMQGKGMVLNERGVWTTGTFTGFGDIFNKTHTESVQDQSA